VEADLPSRNHYAPHPDRGQRRPADLNAALRSTLTVANNELKYVAVVNTDFGPLRRSSSMTGAWRACLKAAGITERFTPHGLRRTFNDMLRRAKMDPVIAKALTGHVTDQMREHYSTVGLDEKRAAVASVLRLLPRRESADNGADAAPAAIDTTASGAAKAAK
jgi:integrase